MKMRGAFLMIAAIAATTGLSSATTYRIFDPRGHLDETQTAIIDEIEDVYCLKRQPGQYFPGEAAALSRVAVRAGLGSLAIAVTTKCALIHRREPLPNQQADAELAQLRTRAAAERQSVPIVGK
jgi:hypothetical protein